MSTLLYKITENPIHTSFVSKKNDLKLTFNIYDHIFDGNSSFCAISKLAIRSFTQMINCEREEIANIAET